MLTRGLKAPGRASPVSVPPPGPTVVVRPEVVARTLGAAIVVLTALSVLGQVSKFVFNHDHVYGLVNLFNLDGEANVPTWFSTVLLLGCGAVLALLAAEARAAGGRDWLHWAILAMTFIYISADEASYIHELLNEPIRGLLGNVPPLLYYPWVLVAAVFVVIVGVAYVRFMLALPGPTRAQVVIAGGLYVGGALLVELPGSYYAAHYGTEHLAYSLITTAEEVMELAGLTLFLYALLVYQSATYGVVRIDTPRARKSGS